MGYAGINETKKLILRPLLVEHDAVRDVDDLDDGFAFQGAALDLNVSALVLLLLNNFEDRVFNLIVVYVKEVCQTVLFFKIDVCFL